MDVPIAVDPGARADCTVEMPVTGEEPSEEDESATQMFRSSRPPRIRVERVSVVPAPASSTRELEPPSTERDPLSPRSRGMLPVRAARGRG
jgi:hypothetical protein